MKEQELRASSQAQQIVEQVLTKGGTAVDATAGNGHDTLFLSRLAGTDGTVLAFDTQEQALENTEALLEKSGAPDNVTLIQANHACFAEPDRLPEQVDVFMYNLGYLPGGDHGCMTESGDTVCSLEAAVSRLKPGGLITVCLYPHNPEETEKVEAFCRNLTDGLSAFIVKRLNRNNPPFLIVITKEDE